VQQFNHRWGCEFPQSGTAAAELKSEIIQRLGTVDETTIGMIHEAIADALAGWQPQW